MDKYIDNKLAEELDLIVLVKNDHAEKGLPKGSVGTLIESYTGQNNPLYGDFKLRNGKHVEEALALNDFRVLNPRSDFDVELIAEYMRTHTPKRAV